MDTEADTNQSHVANNKLINNKFFSSMLLAAAVNKDNPICGMTLLQVDRISSSTLKRGDRYACKLDARQGAMHRCWKWRESVRLIKRSAGVPPFPAAGDDLAA